jgi:hypothetical protein
MKLDPIFGTRLNGSWIWKKWAKTKFKKSLKIVRTAQQHSYELSHFTAVGGDALMAQGWH